MRGLGLAALAAVVAVSVWATAATAAPNSKLAITPSPAYTANQLAADPGNDWLSNMGNLAGTRHSSLTQITKSNVATLKLAWKNNLGTCPTKDQNCGSLEANAAVANGVYYIQTPTATTVASAASTTPRMHTS